MVYNSERKRPQVRKRKKSGYRLTVGAALAVILLGGILGVCVLTDPAPAARAVPTPEPTAVPDTPALPVLQVERLTGPETAAQTEPTVLIYHTHTTEAYTPSPGYEYTPDGGQWRTHDTNCNIVQVGELLAKTLQEQYGLCVIHDTTDHEPPKLSSAYSRSEATMKQYLQQYPSLRLFIDVHRDAYGADGGEEDDVIIDGQRTAKLMFVVGTGKGATGTGFDEMPDFESNYALAEEITRQLRLTDPALVRQIRVKSGRYNQHVSDQCLLVEVGHNRNTLPEALNAVPFLAAAIASAAENAGQTVPSQRPTPFVPQT